jgi:L-ascorbate metabolism protein UlaG (beta-lactamase superfamily)
VTTRITYHGVACYEAVGPRGRVLLDPFLTGNPVADVGPGDLATPTVILASHAAWDHMQDAAAVALRTGAPVVCGTDTAALLREAGVPDEQIRMTVWGIRVKVGDIVVHPVECHHWSQARLADGQVITGVPMGFVVETEPGVSVYHFGDTAVFGDLALIGKLHRPTVGLLGVTQPWSLVNPGAGEVVTGEMNPQEAALAAELLGVRYAVATHYDDPEHRDVKEFLDLVPREDTTGARVPLALRPGETLVIDGEHHTVEEAA